MSMTKPLTQDSGISAEEEEEKVLRAVSIAWPQGNCVFQTQNWCKYELIEIVAAHTSLHRFKPDKIPEQRRGGGHKVPFLTKKLFALFSPMDYHWVYHPYTRADMMPKHNLLTQIGLHMFFVLFFSFLIWFSFPNFCCSYLDVVLEREMTKIDR